MGDILQFAACCHNLNEQLPYAFNCALGAMPIAWDWPGAAMARLEVRVPPTALAGR